MRKLVLAAALAAGTWAPHAAGSDFKVESRDFVKHLTFTGELQAVESVRVRAPYLRSAWSFTITYLAPEGSRVQAGNLLVEFDASSLLLKRLESEKKIEDARIQIAQKETEIEEERQDLLLQQASSLKELKVAELYVDLDPELITRAQAEEYQLNYSKAKLGLEKVDEQLATLEKSAQSDLELVRLEYDRAHLELRRTLAEVKQMRAYAPMSGVVVYGENWNEGRKLQEGDTVFRLNNVILLPNMQKAMVVAYVYDTDFAQLGEGMSAEVVLDAVPGRTFRGRVMALPQAASPKRRQSQLKVFRVPVELPESDPALMKPGMTARIRVAISRREALVVPRRAVRLGAEGETYVMLRASLPRPLAVQVLDGNDHYLWVAGTQDTELKAGQAILVDGFRAQDSVDEHIEWIPIRRENLTFTVPGSGVLRTEKSVDIRPPILANHWQFTIVRMVAEGAKVKRGDFLLEFDPVEIQKQLRDEEASFEKAVQESEKTESSRELKMKNQELQLEEARVGKEKAQNKLVRARELEGMLKVLEAKYDAVLARQRVEMMEKKLASVRKNTQLRLQLLKEAEDFYRHRVDAYQKARNALLINAPTSGVVIYRTNRRNEKKNVGSSVWMTESVLALADLRTLIIEGQVAEVDAGKVQAGREVEVTLDTLPNQTFSGKIVEISSVFKQASPDRPIKIFEFRVKLKRVETKRMRPGMAARLRVVVDRFENILSVPLSVLDQRDGKSYLWVRGKGRAVKRQVKVGRDNGMVAVIESGLEEGEQVASRPELVNGE